MASQVMHRGRTGGRYAHRGASLGRFNERFELSEPTADDELNVLSSNEKKHMKTIETRMRQGLVDTSKDPFELLISSTEIRFTYYAEIHKVLGNTYGMCILRTLRP